MPWGLCTQQDGKQLRHRLVLSVGLGNEMRSLFLCLNFGIETWLIETGFHTSAVNFSHVVLWFADRLLVWNVALLPGLHLRSLGVLVASGSRNENGMVGSRVLSF